MITMIAKIMVKAKWHDISNADVDADAESSFMIPGWNIRSYTLYNNHERGPQYHDQASTSRLFLLQVGFE